MCYTIVMAKTKRVAAGCLFGLALGDALAAPTEFMRSAKEIEANFDLGYHFKHVDTIFKRVFGKN